MNILAFFTTSVLAAESIISPIPADGIVVVHKPVKTFGQIATTGAGTAILGAQSETEPVTADQQSPAILSPTPTESKKSISAISPRSLQSDYTGKEQTEEIVPIITKQKNYTIAFLGDSMIDTLGPGIPHTLDALRKQYPQTSFTLLNYGVGATNIEYGLHRITHDYTYLDSPVPSLVSKNPDIVVIESFGYNPFPFDEGALDKHWLSLAIAADTIRQHIPKAKIVYAVTVAPNSALFGDGAPGLSFSAEDKWKKTQIIKKYLESTIKFAKSQNYPLIDAYSPSLTSDGNGNAVYIHAGDHIHTSDEGKRLFAAETVKTLRDSGVIQ